MNNTKTAAAGPHSAHLHNTCLRAARPQSAAWHAAPATLPIFDDAATSAVCDSGRIRIGAAFRLVTQR